MDHSHPTHPPSHSESPLLFHGTSHFQSVSHSIHLVLCDIRYIVSPTHPTVPLYTSFILLNPTNPSHDDPKLHSYWSERPYLTITSPSSTNLLLFVSDPHEYDEVEANSHSLSIPT